MPIVRPRQAQVRQFHAVEREGFFRRGKLHRLAHVAGAVAQLRPPEGAQAISRDQRGLEKAAGNGVGETPRLIGQPQRAEAGRAVQPERRRGQVAGGKITGLGRGEFFAGQSREVEDAVGFAQADEQEVHALLPDEREGRGPRKPGVRPLVDAGGDAPRARRERKLGGGRAVRRCLEGEVIRRRWRRRRADVKNPARAHRAQIAVMIARLRLQVHLADANHGRLAGKIRARPGRHLGEHAAVFAGQRDNPVGVHADRDGETSVARPRLLGGNTEQFRALLVEPQVREFVHHGDGMDAAVSHLPACSDHLVFQGEHPVLRSGDCLARIGARIFDAGCESAGAGSESRQQRGGEGEKISRGAVHGRENPGIPRRRFIARAWAVARRWT